MRYPLFGFYTISVSVRPTPLDIGNPPLPILANRGLVLVFGYLSGDVYFVRKE